MSKQTFPHFDGSLILTGPGTCAGYVLNLNRGAFDPSGLLGELTPEQIEAHNRTLGAAEMEAMGAKGAGVLYLTHSADGWTVTNWSGSWKARAYITSGRHNIARVQRSVHFTGPDGKRWAGRQYGDNGQNFTAKRLKG